MPKVYILMFSNARHSHRIRTNVSSSAAHLLHEWVFALLILCSIYCKLICLVSSPTSILQCFLYSLLMDNTYLSVGPSKHSWLVLSLSDSPFRLFPFSYPFLILGLNLLKDRGRKGSGPTGLILAPSLASPSAVPFCWMPLCPGPTLWLPGLLPTVLSAFLHSLLKAVISFDSLLGLQLPLGY